MDNPQAGDTTEETTMSEHSEPENAVASPGDHDAILHELGQVKKMVKGLVITVVVVGTLFASVVVLGVGLRVFGHDDARFGHRESHQFYRGEMRPGGPGMREPNFDDRFDVHPDRPLDSQSDSTGSRTPSTTLNNG